MKEKSNYKLNGLQKFYRFIKACIDFFVALMSLIVLSPLFLIVAIAIKIDSPGPVFFVQKRVGKGGKLFNCIKFRSMSTEARHDVAGYEYEGIDSYFTKVGSFIRKFSIDELPQLFNMLTLKMSLIGYRPSQENETELNDAREEFNMYQIRPGITGWAQVNGRDALAAFPKKKAEFDAYYLQHFSFWLDIKIFFMTIIKVFKSDDVMEGVLTTQQSEEDKDCVTDDDVIAEAVASEFDAENKIIDDSSSFYESNEVGDEVNIVFDKNSVDDSIDADIIND